jgi:hypothetical protein
VKAIWSAEYCKTERHLSNATRKKGIGVIYHVRDVEGLVSCAEFNWIEIRLVLTNAGDIFPRASISSLCTVLFSGNMNEGAIEQKKQAEIPKIRAFVIASTMYNGSNHELKTSRGNTSLRLLRISF